MKSKKTLYILIPAVIIIWGLIMWKVFDFTSESKVNTLPTYQKASIDTIMNTPYSLSLNYHDPFLKLTSISKTTTSKKNNNIREVIIDRVVKSIIPPKLNYYGLIQCGSTNTALLEINNQKLLLKQNEAFNEVKIIKFNNDSIWLSYQEKTFSYAKNN